MARKNFCIVIVRRGQYPKFVGYYPTLRKADDKISNLRRLYPAAVIRSGFDSTLWRAQAASRIPFENIYLIRKHQLEYLFSVVTSYV